MREEEAVGRGKAGPPAVTTPGQGGVGRCRTAVPRKNRGTFGTKKLLFDLSPHRERLCDHTAKPVVLPPHRVVGERPDLFDIGFAVRSEDALTHLYIQDLSDELGMHADIDRLEEPALEDDRELPDIRCAHALTLHGREARVGELIGIMAGDDAEVVGFLHVIDRRYADRELAMLEQVLVGLPVPLDRDCHRRGVG